MTDMIDRVEAALAEVIADSSNPKLASAFGLFLAEHKGELGRAALAAIRELPEQPGPRYTAGEYSRRNQQAMVDDALGT